MERNSNSGDDHEKLLHSNSTENDLVDEEEEEEALSLCDLPINEENQSKKDQDQDQKPTKIEEDFDFGSWGGGSVLTESEMCSADEIFFQGHILPYRCSVSSDTGYGLTAGVHSRCLSRSESMDHLNSGGLFTSNVSSRSSSIRSHNSSSSSCASIKNRFHSHPSPSPQIRIQSSKNWNPGRSSNKSTMWRFLQVGVVRTPDIELEKLKLRRTMSSTSSIVGSTVKINRARDKARSLNSRFNGENDKVGSKNERKKKQLGGLFGGCKCSINSVDQTVHPRNVVSRSNSVKVEERQQEGNGMKKIKQTTSRHRTFEWIKELSHVGVPD